MSPRRGGEQIEQLMDTNETETNTVVVNVTHPTHPYGHFESYIDFCRQSKQDNCNIRCYNLNIWNLVDLEMTEADFDERIKVLENPQVIEEALSEFQEFLPLNIDYSNVYSVSRDGQNIYEHYDLKEGTSRQVVVLMMALRKKFSSIWKIEHLDTLRYITRLVWNKSDIHESQHLYIHRILNDTPYFGVIQVYCAHGSFNNVNQEEIKEIFGDQVYQEGVQKITSSGRSLDECQFQSYSLIEHE